MTTKKIKITHDGTYFVTYGMKIDFNSPIFMIRTYLKVHKSIKTESYQFLSSDYSNFSGFPASKSIFINLRKGDVIGLFFSSRIPKSFLSGTTQKTFLTVSKFDQ